MDPNRAEQGSILLMFLGIVVVLAVLATAIVTLTANVQWGTARDRSRAKAFNVAEAGLDLGQQKLAASWPSAASAQLMPPLQTSDFLALADTAGNAFLSDSEYPHLAAKVVFFDNPWPDGTYHSPYSAADPPAFDANDDGMIYVHSEATVGPRSSGVQALVSKVELNLRLPPGVVLYTDGPLEVKGTGSQDPFGVDPPATSTSVYADPATTTRSGNPNFPNPTTPQVWDPPHVTAATVFPALADVIDAAAIAGREFADEADFDAHGGWRMANASAPNIVVIDSGDISLPATTSQNLVSLWSQAEPGILIVRNGNVIINGQTTFWGIIYCRNAFNDTGTPAIHGVVIAEGSATLKGDRAVIYNPYVIANLNRMVISSVRIVPGTWRELRVSAPPQP